MTATPNAAAAVLAVFLAVPSGATAQDGAPESYMRFFGSVHEPVSKRTSGAVPTAFTADGIARLADEGADDLGNIDAGGAGALANQSQALGALIGSRRQETSLGYGGGVVLGARFSPRIGAELEVAHRTHDIKGATSEDAYMANEAAFALAAQQLRDGDAVTVPALVEPTAEGTVAVTTYMANAAYFFPALGRVAPYAAAGIGWASPAGDVSDYDGNVAYQVRAGADLDLGPVLVGVQGTYVGAGDFERDLAAPSLTGPGSITDAPFGEPGKASVEYGTAEVAVTLTVPLSRR